MHRRIALLLGLICAGQAFAALTTVQDTLYTASGSYCSGTLTLTWQTFTAPDGHLIQGGSFTSTVAASVNGLSVTIEPGQYTASYQLTPNLCAPAYEQWLVPVSGSPVLLSQVRSINPPIPFTLISPGYIAQDGAAPGQGLCWNGSIWLPGVCTSGSIASTTNALVGNGAGGAIAASGTGSNCVHVDGSSATCGGGGGSTTDLREFKTLCENTVAGGNFDLVAGTNMPQYNCHAGLSNTEFGTLDFTGAATGTQGAAIFHTQMPNSWTSVVFDLSWLSSDASSGVSATWYLQIACVAATGASLDPTWDSARSYSSANQATANYSNAISSQTLTLPGACTSGTPGPMLFARIYRNGSDTLGSSYAASLVSARLTIVHP